MYLEKTPRFSVLTVSSKSAAAAAALLAQDTAAQTKPKKGIRRSVPTLELSRLLKSNGAAASNAVRDELLSALQLHGFVVLTVPRSSMPARIIDDMKQSLTDDFFADSGATSESSFSETGTIYISEKGVPMWKVGYESCEDGVREAFRVASGSPDDGPWPSQEARSSWLQGLALCRHVCDCALQAVTEGVGDDRSSNNDVKMRKRPGSGGASWKKKDYCQTPVGQLSERSGDYSVLYAMHYFNQEDTPFMDQDGDIRISVKQHVDPSLFVLEPFLAEQPGLQVFSQGKWITCDGPSSPIHGALSDDEMGMVLFVGKAFSNHMVQEKIAEIQPTLHRVITAGRRRTTMIYEQKYAEFFPAPIMD